MREGKVRGRHRNREEGGETKKGGERGSVSTNVGLRARLTSALLCSPFIEAGGGYRQHYYANHTACH